VDGSNESTIIFGTDGMGFTPHESENILSGGRNDLHVGGARPRGANLYGVASNNWGLVSTEVSELCRPRRRWWPRSFRV